MGYWNLETLWFGLIAVLWVGYFVLEGFDYGVGMLMRVVGRDPTDRRVVIHAIGPVWDGNEVWLLTAGGATFAAFPEWYATLFSGFYLPLLLILVALIVRGVAFEFWGKHDTARWRSAWEWAIQVGSFVPALLWGVAFANILRGVPIDAQKEFTGTLLDLLNPYALLGGLTTLLLFLAHGSSFLALKTRGEVHDRSRTAQRVLVPLAALSLAGFVAWTLGRSVDNGWGAIVAGSVAVAALLAAVALSRAGREGWAFTSGAVGVAGLVATFFLELYPNVMVSSTSAAFNLTVFNASSTHYTLTVMTVIALVLTPVVLLYQGWTYYVFRRRIGREDVTAVTSPIDLLAERAARRPEPAAGGPSGPGAPRPGAP